jgi:hypothetical protein
MQQQLAALMPPSQAAAAAHHSGSSPMQQQQQQLSGAMQRRIQHNIQLAARCAKLESEKQQLAREKEEVQGEHFCFAALSTCSRTCTVLVFEALGVTHSSLLVTCSSLQALLPYCSRRRVASDGHAWLRLLQAS